eukprot:gnl/TRDRNA2_/TRDRNA2_158291_c0_seq2.p1 gnl/TRDRNA2_/TRDRNA2_158291_c0~~gnl/TRDRNA2_/TRDRNA2_158291_c0_seq2.p1  ORF type:complete len:545 (-),score=138.43 gnl/TRDRNA2_/TRDRNA2_158291_c0_seq2:68-1516(-)
MAFQDVDRHVFEWLYILEEYRGDILDSTLQTLKYLQYEFFATSAHAISSSLPARMEFRPMVEMTPEHLEAQVEMELQESEDMTETGEDPQENVADFSRKLIDKKAREDPNKDDGPALPVCALSLSCLLSQGFEEGPARRALRLHKNDTQAALDWLIEGGPEGTQERSKIQQQDGVRMPTTVKRVQKLKAMRRAQAEKARRDRGEEDDPAKRETARGDKGATSGSSSEDDEDRAAPHPARAREAKAKAEKAAAAASSSQAPAQPVDLMSMTDTGGGNASSGADMDLLGFGAEERPTDFSQPVNTLPLPPQLSFDITKCEKGPLDAAVEKGIAQPRNPIGGDDFSTMSIGPPPSSGNSMVTTPTSSAGGQGLSAETLAAAQALAAQAGVSPQQLLLAAQQLQQQQAPAASPAPAAPSQPGFSPPPRSPMGSGTPTQAPASAPGGGFAGLDPLAGTTAPPPAAAPPASPPQRKSSDPFGDIATLK